MFVLFPSDNYPRKAYTYNKGKGDGQNGGEIMKTMIIREDSRGRNTRVNAKNTYRSASGDWVAEMDEKEYSKACSYVCQGVENCVWEKLHVYADQDDDGKEYKVSTN